MNWSSALERKFNEIEKKKKKSKEKKHWLRKRRQGGHRWTQKGTYASDWSWTLRSSKNSIVILYTPLPMHIYDEQVYFFINHTLKDTYPLFDASWWSLRKSLCFWGWTWTISRQGKETAPQEKHITKGKAHQEHTHLPSMISRAHPWDAEMLEAKWVPLR